MRFSVLLRQIKIFIFYLKYLIKNEWNRQIQFFQSLLLDDLSHLVEFSQSNTACKFVQKITNCELKLEYYITLSNGYWSLCYIGF